MSELENTVTQQASADDGFLAGLNGEEYEETQSEEREANEPLTQEESAGEEHAEEQASSEEESAKESATTADGEKPDAPPEDELFEVIFMGEKKLLNKDEMRDYAEKGMNLDRTRQQLNASRASVAQLEAELAAPRAGAAIFPLVKAYAQAMGGSLQELTQNMMEAVRAAGVTVEKPTRGSYMREKAIADWQDFMKAYPDVRDPKTELAPEIWEAIRSGLSPRAAYVEYRQKGIDAALAEKDRAIEEKDGRIAELERQVETLKLNESNRQKAAGRLGSTAEKEDRTGFLAGLMN